jgi:hypothetical protein
MDKMVSAAMPNTMTEIALRRIEPSARARCSRRSVPAICMVAAALFDRPFGVTARVAVAARSVTLLISRWKTNRTSSASTSTNAIRPAWLTGPAR